MKKRNKNSCRINRLWPNLKDLKKDLFIDLDKQEIIRLSTGNKMKFFLVGSKKNDNTYYGINFKKNCLRVHRLFFYWHYGYLPKLVDHKDRNRFNNKIENLRESTKSNNNRNKNKTKKKTSSKYKGVTWEKTTKKWKAQFSFNAKNIRIGAYESEDEAGQAINNKIRELGLEEVSVMNNTPQERVKKNNQFDPLPEEINNIKNLFKNIQPMGDLK